MHKRVKKIWFVGTGIAILAIAAVVILAVKPFSHSPKKQSVFQSADQDTKGESATGSQNPINSQASVLGTNNGAEPGDNKSSAGGSSQPSTVLETPIGHFVSNHGQPPDPPVTLNSSETSVCNTTPGATCSISFSQNGATPKSLAAETTDAGGSAYWNNWTPSSIGLTSGSWTVTAIATLNGQTQTATDAMTLDIQ